MQVHAWMSRNGNLALLNRMLELPVTSNSPRQVPTVFVKPFQHLPFFIVSLHPVVKAVDECEDFGDGTVQRFRYMGLDVEFGQNRNEVGVFVDLDAVGLAEFDDTFGYIPRPFRDHARGGIALLVVAQGHGTLAALFAGRGLLVHAFT